VISFFPDVNLRIVEAAEAQEVDPDPWCFFNINAPEDLARAEQHLRADPEDNP
jgi:molybdopterin-guanine dinucleotide biosynthesis protein A